VLVLNSIQFHSPLRTGNAYWANPSWLAEHPLFSCHYIPYNTAMLWRELGLRPQRLASANHFGTGTCFVAAFILLACVGLFFSRPSRFAICAFLAGLSFFALTISFYPCMDLRYYLPLLMLLVAVAVLPVTWAAENLVLPKRTIVSLAIFVLFAAACLGYPSRSVNPRLKADRLQSWEALHFGTHTRQSAECNAQRRFVEMVGQEEGGIVFSDISPVYLNALFPPGFVAAPFDGERYIHFRHICITITRKRSHSRNSAYTGQFQFTRCSFQPRNSMKSVTIAEHSWLPVGASRDTMGEAVILRLTSAQ
jgi:hypothetical protein